MSKDKPVVVERLMLYNVERFKQERSDALNRAVVFSLAFLNVLVIAVLWLDGSLSAILARLLGGN